MQSYRRSGSLFFGLAVGTALLVAGVAHAQDWNNWNRDNWRDNGWRDDRDHREYDRDDHRDDWRDQRRDDRGNDGRGDNNDVTERQKNACKPDVFRLCSWYIPSREKITACLHDNIDKLNPNCRAVMEGRLR